MVPRLTYTSDINCHIHVAMLSAVIHGLPQGPQFGLAVAAGTQGGRGCFWQVSPLSQNLLQGQDIVLLLLWLSEQLAEHIPVNHKPREEDTERWKEPCWEQGHSRGLGSCSLRTRNERIIPRWWLYGWRVLGMKEMVGYDWPCFLEDMLRLNNIQKVLELSPFEQ